MNSHADHFDPVLKKMKEKEQKFKKRNPFAWSPFMCTICEEKYRTCNMTILKEKPSQNGLSSMNNDFQAK